MKIKYSILLILFFSLSVAPLLYAGIQKSVQEECFRDETGTLSAKTKSEINRLCHNLLLRTGLRMIVTVVAHLGDLSEKERANQLFEEYAQKDPSFFTNGIVVLVSFGDRKMRIELGKAPAEKMSNSEAKNIIDQDFIPHFRQGKTDLGLTTGVASIAEWFQTH
ncbi:TPM domain-containing protein [Leptospira gomenensis]|uniref:TPM domain-containing protein n=1 Tax=Leptospira gomenensis TaxID=2484974 RepID=A0A5F1YG39_9LEPT|nr:TPM domain-containing protein [Leptospira gomenensis]TGK34332.1 TPM domain-containing protein [Leptospira gomenensis]TGK37306.1 TPM domain-containing protein [Leptospira gomenensis]TGK50993.1 TPM domain-containing protein [Leptospira gomenensis]TGK56615.1 TPM domain-containing protein [Leptospira gomenensis]